MKLFFPGNHESLKWSVHAGLFGLSAVCVLYNAAAFVLRRDAHLARNVALYAALAGIELAQMERHR